MIAVDTLIEARWVVPVLPKGVVLENCTVAVANGQIVALLPTEQARASYSAPERVVLERHALMPGLVNAHCHAAMSLMRGIADDLPLMTWLKCASARNVRSSSRLS